MRGVCRGKYCVKQVDSFFFIIVLYEMAVDFVCKKTGRVSSENVGVFVRKVKVGYHALDGFAQPDIVSVDL